MLERAIGLCMSAALLLAVTVVPAAAQDPQEPATTGPTPVHLVVDTSGSMSGSRLTQAQGALRATIAALETDQPAGLRSYAGGCTNGGILRVPIGTGNRTELGAATDALRASGGTPTPAALTAAANDLPDGKGTIVLVSDGASTCGDPCPTAQQLAEDLGIEFRVFTVGFFAPQNAESELACIADATGGTYVSATDEQGLADAIGGAIGAPSGPSYVAIGDSTTTGFSIPTCDGDRVASEYGCTGQPPATPYPDRIAAARSDLEPYIRKGIWGDTITRTMAAYGNDQNAPGEPWEPQLNVAETAQDLVTVSLGANDMEWSDITTYMSNCVSVPTTRIWRVNVVSGAPGVDDNACRAFVGEKFDQFADELDHLLDTLEQPAANGADIVVVLYPNPFNETRYVERRFRSDGERDCSLLHEMTDVVLAKLNTELAAGAQQRGFFTADLTGPFDGHGAGSRDPYVFGADCEWRGSLTAPRADISLRNRRLDVRDPTFRQLGERFDPHPNATGTRVQAETILEVLR